MLLQIEPRPNAAELLWSRAIENFLYSSSQISACVHNIKALCFCGKRFVYCTDVAATLEGIDNDKFKETEASLVDYLKKCGNFKSKINSFSDWLSLMSLTGQMHGGTLSYTRFIGVFDIARWRNIHSDIWDDNDFNLIVGGLGTITGMEPGHHVMSAKKGPSSGFEESLQKILDKHQAKATDLKHKYQKELIQSPDFDDYGFILSDFCKENFDGKQVTIATYI